MTGVRPIATYIVNTYQNTLDVAAHEFFHAWNVKRLRPRELGPFDYTQMVHTPSLWISEGITDYYAAVALARTGIFSPQRLSGSHGPRDHRARTDRPGRKERSIADTSWDTWFGGGGGGFGAGEPTPRNLINTNYSYYDGGNDAWPAARSGNPRTPRKIGSRSTTGCA